MQALLLLAQGHFFYIFSSDRVYEIEMLIILMSSSGFSLYTFAFSILCTTSMPETARPKIVCLLSSQGYNYVSIAASTKTIMHDLQPSRW
jgi:hypothetical protein